MEARKIEGSNRVSAGSLHEMYGSASIGVSMGYNRETGKEVFQFNEDRFRHTLILGRTGSGKSNHIQLMERQDIRNGAGVAIIASHEEDAIYPLTWVPEWRMNDTVIIDASNKRYLHCLNPLDVNIYDENAVSKAIGNVIELLSTDCHYEWTGPRFKHMVRIGLELILDPGYPYARSIGELEKLFRDAFEGNQTLTGAALRYKVKTLANIATNRLYNNCLEKVMKMNLMEKKKDDYGRITYTLNVVKPQDPVQSELPF